jgi:ABC-type multidrug transport system ATPase subunit
VRLEICAQEGRHTRSGPSENRRPSVGHILPTSPNAESPQIVQLENVTKIFSRFAALRGITLALNAGTLYSMIGENGAGKSTLMRIIAGLAPPTSGSVRLFGTDDLRSVTARLSFMGHQSFLYEELTARENLGYFWKLYSPTLKDLDWLIESVGLEPASPKRVSAYSQGMRQRLSLARALLNSPALLLLDEPFSNVDAHSSSTMVRLLGELRDQGACVVVITHQPALLANVADKEITLHAGMIAQEKNAGPVMHQARS